MSQFYYNHRLFLLEIRYVEELGCDSTLRNMLCFAQISPTRLFLCCTHICVKNCVGCISRCIGLQNNFVGERISFPMGKVAESPFDFSDCLLNFSPLAHGIYKYLLDRYHKNTDIQRPGNQQTLVLFSIFIFNNV